MTALTTAQLDDLERQAKSALTSMTEAACRGVALSPDEVDRALSADVTLQLVAIARAALAWSEARRLHMEGYPDGQPDPPDERTLAYFAARDALLAALEVAP